MDKCKPDEAMLFVNMLMNTRRSVDEMEEFFENERVFLDEEDSVEFDDNKDIYGHLVRTMDALEATIENGNEVDIKDIDEIGHLVQQVFYYTKHMDEKF